MTRVEASPRASCVRCNRVIEVAGFEADWAFARCECGAPSPIPETVRRLRAASFRGGVRRSVADIVAQCPDGVFVAASTEGTAIELRVTVRGTNVWPLLLSRFRAFGLWFWGPSSSRPRDRPVSAMPRLEEPLRAGSELVIRARPEGDRWAIASSHAREVVLDAPFVAIARGASIVVHAGHPVHEEWVAATLPAPAHAKWIAEWIGASLHEHAEREHANDAPHVPSGYRR